MPKVSNEIVNYLFKTEKEKKNCIAIVRQLSRLLLDIFCRLLWAESSARIYVHFDVKPTFMFSLKKTFRLKFFSRFGSHVFWQHEQNQTQIIFYAKHLPDEQNVCLLWLWNDVVQNACKPNNKFSQCGTKKKHTINSKCKISKS